MDKLQQYPIAVELQGDYVHAYTLCIRACMSLGMWGGGLSSSLYTKLSPTGVLPCYVYINKWLLLSHYFPTHTATVPANIP